MSKRCTRTSLASIEDARDASRPQNEQSPRIAAGFVGGRRKRRRVV
ncbi:hypothetical protein [Pigmentiphaga litoralis]|nr:hypothetical protein [Pigmentiphaga litoralis]